MTNEFGGYFAVISLIIELKQKYNGVSEWWRAGATRRALPIYKTSLKTDKKLLKKCTTIVTISNYD